MPNWCDTTYKCVGDPKQLRLLYDAIKKNAKRKIPRVKNGFGTLWLGCIIDQLGGDWETYRCRGEITDFNLEDDGILVINQNTAWCEQEGFRQFIEKKFPGITVYYQEQESGCEVFFTNSFEYFPEKFLLDSYEDWIYFENIEEASEYVSGIVGYTFEANVDAIVTALHDFVEKHQDENPDIFYSFHEFKVAEN